MFPVFPLHFIYCSGLIFVGVCRKCLIMTKTLKSVIQETMGNYLYDEDDGDGGDNCCGDFDILAYLLLRLELYLPV